MSVGGLHDILSHILPIHRQTRTETSEEKSNTSEKTTEYCRTINKHLKRPKNVEINETLLISFIEYSQNGYINIDGPVNGSA